MLSAIAAAAAAVLCATAITVADITLAVPVEQPSLGAIIYLLAVVLCVLRATKPSGPFGSNTIRVAMWSGGGGSARIALGLVVRE
jgi:hypothetical protein